MSASRSGRRNLAQPSRIAKGTVPAQGKLRGDRLLCFRECTPLCKRGESRSRGPRLDRLEPVLLDLDARPGLLQLGLDRVGLLARDTLLDGVRRVVHEV